MQALLMPANPPKTRLALLATLGPLHTETIRYDLDCLRSLVTKLAPDLLFAEVTRDAWENEDFSAATIEMRAALTPASALSDIVLVPAISSPEHFSDFGVSTGWRQWQVKTLERLLRWGGRKADRPEVVHGLLFEAFCHTVCTLTELAWTAEARAGWEKQNEEMVGKILQIIHRDPGRRVLVVVQCQRVHQLELLLKQHLNIVDLVDYREL